MNEDKMEITVDVADFDDWTLVSFYSGVIRCDATTALIVAVETVMTRRGLLLPKPNPNFVNFSERGFAVWREMHPKLKDKQMEEDRQK